ncbi:MAG: tRNA threonylcarbamoyladenosine dehydratase [Thermoguttaceae bacterium]
MEEFGQFHRIGQLLGEKAVERLHRSFVMIAGIGAVGGYALEALARAGVGRFFLVDCDRITRSNIGRQLLATHATVGERKTEAARRRVLDIWPAAQVDVADRLINAESIPELLRFDVRKPDLLIDAIDSLAPKVELLAAALAVKIPVLSSMGAALRTDPSQIRFGRLTDVTHCRLSMMLRKRIRRKGVNTDDIPCVYSTEPVREHLGSGAILSPDVSEDDPRLHGRRRSTLGSLPTVTGIFGLMLANAAIMRLTDGNR